MNTKRPGGGGEVFALTMLLAFSGTVPVGARQAGFRLVEDGRPRAAVVVPAGAPVPVQFAAHELTTHLEQMTAAKFPIVAERPAQGNAIILGENEYSRAAGIDASKLKRDHLEIFLDPDRECEKYYWMMVNIDGSIDSEALFTDGGNRVDDKWKSQAKIATKRQKDRWFAEIALPLEILVEDPAKEIAGSMWGANFCRTMSAPPTRKDTFSGFSPVLRGAFHRPDSFGAVMFGE